MCLEKSERNCLTSYFVVQCSIPREFFFIRVFKAVLSSELLVDQEQKNANCNQQKTRLEASKPSNVFTKALNTSKHLE